VRRARSLLARLGAAPALVLTDVIGATPCNVALRLGEASEVKVVAGVNVPMLWRTLNYLHEPLDSLLHRALAGATQGVMQVAAARPQNQALRPGAHDQDDDNHQQ
jgi:mannose PTS system EIIA component